MLVVYSGRNPERGAGTYTYFTHHFSRFQSVFPPVHGQTEIAAVVRRRVTTAEVLGDRFRCFAILDPGHWGRADRRHGATVGVRVAGVGLIAAPEVPPRGHLGQKCRQTLRFVLVVTRNVSQGIQSGVVVATRQFVGDHLEKVKNTYLIFLKLTFLRERLRFATRDCFEFVKRNNSVCYVTLETVSINS